MPRMKMLIGQPEYIPRIMNSFSSQNKAVSVSVNNKSNIASLRFSMIERISSERPSCGSCGKR